MPIWTRDFGTGPRHDFCLDEVQFMTSRDIWLALDDGHCDSRLHRQGGPLILEQVSGEDIETYQRQLFYWLLIRCGPCVFPQRVEFHQGVPVCRRPDN